MVTIRSSYREILINLQSKAHPCIVKTGSEYREVFINPQSKAHPGIVKIRFRNTEKQMMNSLLTLRFGNLPNTSQILIWTLRTMVSDRQIWTCPKLWATQSKSRSVHTDDSPVTPRRVSLQRAHSSIPSNLLEIMPVEYDWSNLRWNDSWYPNGDHRWWISRLEDIRTKRLRIVSVERICYFKINIDGLRMQKL